MRNYKVKSDPQNYFREQILLFLPWRNEKEEVEDINHALKYTLEFEVIKPTRASL